MFKELIVKIGKALDKRQIPYMIIGGQAVLLYGTPRLTKDIDITLGVNTDRLSDVIGIARALKLTVLPDDYESFVSKTMVLPLKDKVTDIRVDLIFSLTPYEQQAIRRARKIKINRAVIKFSAPEDVIIHKIFAGRPRDIEDVESIVLKNKGLKIGYIRQWLKSFEQSSESGREFLSVLIDIIKRARLVK
ncbi:MAG: nucleotidyltransferase [Planctomycetes bacterium]|nr:nucleotidyltransferase [Planctomycetota bacterium]